MSQRFTGVGVRTGGRVRESLFTVVAGQEYLPLYSRSGDSAVQLT